MLLKRSKLSTVILIIFIIFLVTTSYLLLILTDQEDKEESKVKFEHHHHQYHKLIYEELTKLPKRYTEKNVYIKDELVDRFIENINNNQSKSHNLTKLWAIVNNEWITRTAVVDLKSPYLHQLYYAMRNAKIIKADIDHRGTQLKLLLTLESGQQVIFKPKWYNLTKIINGPVYGGKDRYNGEILAFYLSVLLHKPLTPFSILRSISLINEIQPVATQLLLNTSYQSNNNNKRMCIYGKCYYCTKNDPICDTYDDSNHKYALNGALIFNIKANLKTYRSPWQRTYKNKQLALWQQQDYNYNTNQQNYCKSINKKLNRRRLLDLIELSIFDFLIQNGDRHHYETLSDMVLWLDNGKSFGNPFRQHLDILAPLYQCCMLRTTMLENLKRLSNGNLRRRLLLMPDIKNLITDEHLDALDERLLVVFATIEFCKKYQSSK